METMVKPEGLGDTIHNVINKVTLNKLSPCRKCRKRRKRLNSIFPFNYEH